MKGKSNGQEARFGGKGEIHEGQTLKNGKTRTFWRRTTREKAESVRKSRGRGGSKACFKKGEKTKKRDKTRRRQENDWYRGNLFSEWRERRQ